MVWTRRFLALTKKAWRRFLINTTVSCRRWIVPPYSLEMGISMSSSGNTGRDIKGAGTLELIKDFGGDPMNPVDTTFMSKVFWIGISLPAVSLPGNFSPRPSGSFISKNGSACGPEKGMLFSLKSIFIAQSLYVWCNEEESWWVENPDQRWTHIHRFPLPLHLHV